MTTWTNWAQLVEAHPAQEVSPHDPDEVVEAVVAARHQHLRVKMTGSGHSFTSIAATDGLLLRPSGLRGITAVDREALTVTVLSPTLNNDPEMVDHLRQRIGDNLGIAIQHEALGTGDALRAAIPFIDEMTSIIVMFADHPLLTRDRMVELSASLRPADAAVSLLTCVFANSAGYGRAWRRSGIRRVVLGGARPIREAPRVSEHLTDL